MLTPSFMAFARAMESEEIGKPTECAAPSLRGVVRDSNHRPIAKATLSMQAQDPGILTTHSDATGFYCFSAVHLGVYTLQAHMSGYHDAMVDAIALKKNESKAVDLTLDFAKPSDEKNPSVAQPEFFDEPHFTVAGVTDTTTLGGHGSSETVFRNRDDLAKETANLRKPTSANSQTDSIADQHHLLADAAEKAGKPLEAVREYQRSAELNPSESNVFDWGAELLLHGADEPAIEVFTKGNRLFPHSVRMLTALAVAWEAQGSYDQAVQRLCGASDLNPADPEPYLFMGKMQAVESAQSEAITERLERFVRLQPENALANYYYAASLWKQWRSTEDDAQLARIKSLLEKAVHLDPKLGLAYLQLGALYVEQRDLANAISAYRKAFEATPRLEQAHYRLAQAYRQAGETSKAQAELQLYEQISKQKSEETERQRHELKQFVYELRNTTSAPAQ